MTRAFLSTLSAEELAELAELQRSEPRPGHLGPIKMVVGQFACLVCGRLADRGSRGRPPRFCSAKCSGRHQWLAAREAGKCSRCKSRAPQPNMRACAPCAERDRQRQAKRAKAVSK